MKMETSISISNPPGSQSGGALKTIIIQTHKRRTMAIKHKIYQFSKASGEGEFLVISDLPEDKVLAEYKMNGTDLDGIYTIREDATHLPCDRELRHNLY